MAAPRAACHLLLPSLLVWEQPFAVLSSGCHGGRKEGRTLLAAQPHMGGVRFREQPCSQLVCSSWVEGREGRAPSPVRSALHTEAEVTRPFGDVALGQRQQTQVCGQRLSSALKSPVRLGGLGEGTTMGTGLVRVAQLGHGVGPGRWVWCQKRGNERRKGGGGGGLRCWGGWGSVTTASLHFHMWS